MYYGYPGRGVFVGVWNGLWPIRLIDLMSTPVRDLSAPSVSLGHPARSRCLMDTQGSPLASPKWQTEACASCWRRRPIWPPSTASIWRRAGGSGPTESREADSDRGRDGTQRIAHGIRIGRAKGRIPGAPGHRRTVGRGTSRVARHRSSRCKRRLSGTMRSSAATALSSRSGTGRRLPQRIRSSPRYQICGRSRGRASMRTIALGPIPTAPSGALEARGSGVSQEAASEPHPR